MSATKKPAPVTLGEILQEFVGRGQRAQAAANEQLRLGAAFGWECPICAVVNAEEREKCVGCGAVKR